jgi:hypothetical protein
VQLKAQAALLLEQPYGAFGALNPTGHAAIYLARICAETPTTLRRCRPGEPGSVISRYKGIGHHDWLVIPLIPYLYSVESAGDVPLSANRTQVEALRNLYYERHFMMLDFAGSRCGCFYGGGTELVGSSYERRIYAFRFNTTEEQDDNLIALMNSRQNESHFNLLYQNCADFTRLILNYYLRGTFKRSIFPDAGVTTPKQIASRLNRYARAHPELDLRVIEIPQIPGYRAQSRGNDGIAESIVKNGYAIPVYLLNPYAAGGILVDYLARGRSHIIPRNPQLADAAHLSALTGGKEPVDNQAGIMASVVPLGTGQKASP